MTNISNMHNIPGNMQTFFILKHKLLPLKSLCCLVTEIDLVKKKYIKVSALTLRETYKACSRTKGMCPCYLVGEWEKRR